VNSNVRAGSSPALSTKASSIEEAFFVFCTMIKLTPVLAG